MYQWTHPLGLSTIIPYRDLRSKSATITGIYENERRTLIPAGIPEEIDECKVPWMQQFLFLPPVANETTSRAVKSGFLKISTSKSGPHGKTLISSGASLTRVSYLALSCLFTIAVKPGTKLKERSRKRTSLQPSHSARPP